MTIVISMPDHPATSEGKIDFETVCDLRRKDGQDAGQRTGFGYGSGRSTGASGDRDQSNEISQ